MIRRINAGDEALFCRLSAAFYQTDAVLHPIPVSRHHDIFQEMMRSGDYVEGYILEADDGQPAGYALLLKSYSQEAGGRVIWIDELFILPAYRSHGLGSEFFRYLEQNVPAASYRLEIEPENTRARALYERLGYRPLPYQQMVRRMVD